MPLRLIIGNTFGSRELDLKIQSFVLAQKEGQKRLTEKKNMYLTSGAGGKASLCQCRRCKR